jgi:hypothetical protein
VYIFVIDISLQDCFRSQVRGGRIGSLPPSVGRTGARQIDTADRAFLEVG